MDNKIMDLIEGGLVVSCQALPEEPLHSSFIMSRMAVAAVGEGAVAIRANSVEDIQEIKKLVQVPIIGIIKAVYPDSEVYITPTLKEVKALCEIGVDILALDATPRRRPNGEKLVDIYNFVRDNYPNVLLMADTSALDEVSQACVLGFDFIGTTLYGYTKESEGLNIADDNFLYLKEVLKISTKPVIAEGKIDLPEKAKTVLDLGCFSVVVGSAITRPQEIARKYIEAIKK